MKDTLNQPDILYKQTAKAVAQNCTDTFNIQNMVQSKIYETTQYSELKDKIDRYYQHAEAFMHAVSSDDEDDPLSESAALHSGMRSTSVKLSDLKKSRGKLDICQKKRLKKRVKKISKKIRMEALRADGYNRTSKDLLSLHNLLVDQKKNKRTSAKS